MRVQETTIARVWAYETGQMKPEDIVTLFRDLYRSGELWDLPTRYLDYAGEMLTKGFFNTGAGAN